MSTEETHLDNLLEDGIERNPEGEELSIDGISDDISIDDIEIEDIEIADVDVDGVETEDVEIAGIEIENIDSVEKDTGVSDTSALQEPEPLDVSEIAEDESGIPEASELLDLPDEELELADFVEGADTEPELADLPEISDTEPELADLPEISDTELDLTNLMEDSINDSSEGLGITEAEPEISDMPEMESEIPDTPEMTETEPDISELLQAEPDTAETVEMDPAMGGNLNIDGLDTAIEAETELEMASALDVEELELGTDNEELNLDDMNIADIDIADIDVADINVEDTKADEGFNIDEDIRIDEDLNIDEDTSIGGSGGFDIDEDVRIDDEEIGGDADLDNLTAAEGLDMVDDGLDDVLSMLDADADSDLAEINDMLKKSDNNEPIQDDMMDLLSQMADNEEAFINAGDEEEGASSASNVKTGDKDAGASDGKGAKKAADAEADPNKKPGIFGKFFNMLTEDLVPEPTEEELAAEKEAKQAKKQENQTKKEEEKAAKAEAKKAKAEEQDAAKKAKAEAAAQKKKEKAAAKEAKRAEKAAKEAAKGPKPKRIPPKKIAIAAAFGASVGGAVILTTNILAAQGYLQKARSAYYDADYKTVYLSTYGMNLDNSDEIIQAKSEVILKMQRKYDSYQVNLKMGRSVEALNSLIQGLATYDFINAEAEQYGAMEEVEAIRAEILNTLQAKYGLDEDAAREVLQTEDSLSYTMALRSIILGN